MFNFAEIAGCQFNINRSNVLVEALELARAWNWNDPWLLRQQPGEGDLGGSGILLGSDSFQQVDDHPISFDRFLRKARVAAADISAVVRCVFIDLAGQITTPQPTIRYKSNAKFCQGRQELRFDRSPPDPIFAL